MSKRDDYSAFLSPIKDSSYINTPYISPTRDYPYSIPADDIIQAFKDLQSQSKKLIVDIEECKNINNKYKSKLDEYSNDRNNTSIDSIKNYNNGMNIYTTDILNIETKNQTLLSKVTQLEQDNKEINDKIATNLLYQSQLETYVLDYNIKIKERERQTHLAALEQQTYVNKSNNDNNNASLDYNNSNSSIKESIYIHKHQLQHIHNEIYTQKSIIIDRISEIKQKEILIKHLNTFNTELYTLLTKQQLISLDYQTRMTDLTINRFNFVPAKPSPRTKPYTSTTSKLHSKPALATTTSSSIVYSTSKPPVYSTTPTTILPTSTTGTSRRKSTSYTVHRSENTSATHTRINTVYNNHANTNTNSNTDGMYSSSQELCDRTELLTANQWAQYTSMRNKMRVKLATGVIDTSTLQHHSTPTSLVSQSKPVVYKSTRQNVPIEKYSDNTTSSITSNQTKKTRISKKKKSKSTTSSIVTITTTRVPSSVFPSSTLPAHLTFNHTTSNPTASAPDIYTSYTAPLHLFTDMNSGSPHLPRGGSTDTGRDLLNMPFDAVDYNSNNSANSNSNRVYSTDVYSDSNAHVSSTDYRYTKLSDEQLKAYHNILSQPPLGQNYDPYHPVRLYDSDQGDRFIPTPDSHTYTAENDDDDSTGSNNEVDERDVSIHIIYDPTIATSLYDIEEPAAVTVIPVCTVLTPVFLPTSIDPDPTKEFNLIAQQSMASPSNAGRHSSSGGGGLTQTLLKSTSGKCV